MRKFKIIFFNALGTVGGITVGWIAFLVSKLILIDILGNIKWLAGILSWPVDYDTYAFTGIIFVVAYASLYVCQWLSEFGQGRFHTSCILVGLYEIAVFLISIIEAIAEHGFGFDSVWMIIVILLAFIAPTLSAASGELL